MKRTLKSLSGPLFLLFLVTLMGCLVRGTGEPDIFVDESPFGGLGGAEFNSGEGGFCRASSDCSGSLRCINSQGFQFCVETCASTSECDTGQCNPVQSDDGWCALPSQDIGTPSTGDNPDQDDTPDTVGDPGDDPGIDPLPDPLPDTDPGGDPAGSPADNPSAGGDCGDSQESEQFRLLNADRVNEGFAPLLCHLQVGDVARAHSKDMSDRGYFDHVNPEGEQPWDRMDRGGVQGWRSAGENIAYGYITPAEVQEGWMNSPGHRANILNGDFTHVGIGRFVDNQGLPYWTQLFARF